MARLGFHKPAGNGVARPHGADPARAESLEAELKAIHEAIEREYETLFRGEFRPILVEKQLDREIEEIRRRRRQEGFVPV